MKRSQDNPCSGLVSFVVNIPSYLFDGANTTTLSAMTIKVEAAHLIAPERNIAQNQGTTTASIGQNPTTPTCQQV